MTHPGTNSACRTCDPHTSFSMDRNSDTSQADAVSDSEDDACQCVECGVRCGYWQLCGRTVCDASYLGNTGACVVCDERGVLLVDDERCALCAEPVRCAVCGQEGSLGGGFSMFCACQAYCDTCVQYAGVDCQMCVIRGPYVMHGRRVHLLC